MAEKARRLAAVLVLGVLSAACGATASRPSTSPNPQGAGISAPAAATLAELRLRPISLPPAASGGGCATTSFHDLKPVVQGGKGKGPGFGFGPGPAYLSGITQFYPGGFDNEIWLLDPTYTGPLLVRGRELGGSRTVLFEQPVTYPSAGLSDPGSPPPGKPAATIKIAGAQTPFFDELDLPAAPPAGTAGYWRMFFARTHIEDPGCYGFQLDGTDFTITIVIQVPDAARQGG